MKNKNKVVLQGRLVADPELMSTKAGDSVCNIFVASQRKYSKKREEEKVDIVKCEAWGGTADFICKCFKKGSMVDIEGGIRCKKWKDENDKTRVDQFVHIDTIEYSATNNSPHNKSEDTTE